MVNWKRNLFLVWLAQFLSIAGFCFAFPFIPFYIQSLGVSDMAARNMWVAVFAAAGSVSLCVASPIWGFVADIYGRRIMILRATFASALLMPLMAFVPGPGWLVFIRVLVGIFSGTVSASQILISSNTPQQRRGFALGTLSSAVYSGSMAGCFLGGVVVDRFGYKNAFLLCGAMLLVAGMLVLFGVKEDFRRTTTLRDKLRGLRLRPPDFGPAWGVLLLILLIGFVTQFDAPFMPVLVEAVHGPDKAATWTGVIASLAACAGILSGTALGWLADRWTARKVATLSALLSGLLLLPQAVAGSLGLLMAARFGMVFFAGGLDPVFQIWLAKSTPDRQRGLLFGWATSAKSLGWTASALLSGAVAASCGVRWVFVVAAVLFLLLIPAIHVATRNFRSA